MDVTFKKANKKRVAIVESRQNQGVNEDLGGINSQMPPDAANAIQLEKALPPKRTDVLGETKMAVNDDTQVKDGVRRLNQDVANQKWLTLDQIPALRGRGVKKAGFTSIRHHPVAGEPVVGNLERSRKFVTGDLLLSCTEEKAEGYVASSVIRKLTNINALAEVVTSNNRR
jgi:hypothetical protein